LRSHSLQKFFAIKLSSVQIVIVSPTVIARSSVLVIEEGIRQPGIDQENFSAGSDEFETGLSIPGQLRCHFLTKTKTSG